MKCQVVTVTTLTEADQEIIVKIEVRSMGAVVVTTAALVMRDAVMMTRFVVRMIPQLAVPVLTRITMAQAATDKAVVATKVVDREIVATAMKEVVAVATTVVVVGLETVAVTVVVDTPAADSEVVLKPQILLKGLNSRFFPTISGLNISTRA
jgi:hypothetical protein